MDVKKAEIKVEDVTPNGELKSKEASVEFEKKKKKGGKINKIIMGAVIGGAIGSVVGASVKNKNRSDSENADEKGKKKGFFWKIKRLFSRKK